MHRTLLSALACGLCLLLPARGGAETDFHPLRPADTSSPRATLESFRADMNDYYRLIKAQGADADPSRLAVLKVRAIRCLDLGNVDASVRADLGMRRAVVLTEILDRIALPAPGEVPDAEAMARSKITRWRIPDTEIAIARVMDGPREGEYLFSADTVSRIPEFYERVRDLPYRKGTVLEHAFDTLYTLAPPPAAASSPLRPADTKSPQATLRTFLDSINAVYRSVQTHDMSPEALAGRRQHIHRVLGTLDLSDVPPNVADRVGEETAVLLSEVFDRIALPVLERVPDARQVAETGITSWTIPDTGITIARVAQGPNHGEFLFSPETVRQAKTFYEQIQHLPYKDGTVLPSAYYAYLQAPGRFVPGTWIQKLPWSMQRITWGQPLWKWISLALVLAVVAGGLALAFRLSGRRGHGDAHPPFRRRVVFPVVGIALAWFAQGTIDQLNIGRDTVYLTSVAFTLLGAFFLFWLVVIVSHALAEAIASSSRVRPQSMDAQVVRFSFRLVIIGGFVAIVLRTAQELGVPLTPVLAGLGVGGLAIALAAQNTMENFIGGLNLFTDRPIRVGDFCRFGDRVGTVEEIGLRSTRIRSLDDTVIAIPNATFSKMELENFSRRRRIWYHPRIQLAKDVTPDQVRVVLVEVRKMLYAHPRVHPDPARIRFAEFGAYSLDLDVFAYVKATDYGEFLGVAEDLNLRIMDILAQAGARLAVPAQRTVLERSAGTDEARVQQTEQQVREWREQNQLYLPSFPEDVVAKLRQTLDYPPKGAPRGSSG